MDDMIDWHISTGRLGLALIRLQTRKLVGQSVGWDINHIERTAFMAHIRLGFEIARILFWAYCRLIGRYGENNDCSSKLLRTCFCLYL